MTLVPMPSSEDLLKIVISAIQEHGGEATNLDIYQFCVKNLKLTQAQIDVIRSGNRSEIEYRLAWARTKAAKKGLIHRSRPSTWTLGPKE